MPLDFKRKGEIIDDDLHNLLVKPLPKGVRLTAIFDSCHSGTALDLPYIYKASGDYSASGVTTEQMGQGIVDAGVEYITGNTKEASKKIKNVVKTKLFSKKKMKELRKKNTSKAEVIMFAGCREDQTSADASLGGKTTGAMSYALITTLSRKPKQTLKELLNSMRAFVEEEGFDQVPQISTGKPTDPDIVFKL